MTTTNTLIRDAQAGLDGAKDAFFRLVIEEHMPKRVGRYLHRNVLVDADDIESDFLYGCLRALPETDLDRGNPLLYILWKGDMAVKELFRKRIGREVRLQCNVCSFTGRGKYERGHSVCPRCGTRDVSTWMRIPGGKSEGDLAVGVSQIDKLSDGLDIDAIFFLATERVVVQEMRARLKPGRVRELFEIIVIEGINAASSKNYLREIATRWGCSTAAVSVHLRKLRIAVAEYLAV